MRTLEDQVVHCQEILALGDLVEDPVRRRLGALAEGAEEAVGKHVHFVTLEVLLGNTATKLARGQEPQVGLDEIEDDEHGLGVLFIVFSVEKEGTTKTNKRRGTHKRESTEKTTYVHGWREKSAHADDLLLACLLVGCLSFVAVACWSDDAELTRELRQADHHFRECLSRPCATSRFVRSFCCLAGLTESGRL